VVEEEEKEREDEEEEMEVAVVVAGRVLKVIAMALLLLLLRLVVRIVPLLLLPPPSSCGDSEVWGREVVLLVGPSTGLRVTIRTDVSIWRGLRMSCGEDGVFARFVSRHK
jgi:hypothetical protein